MIFTILGSSPPCACSLPGWNGAAAGKVTSTNAKPIRPRTPWPDRLLYQGVRDISISFLCLGIGTVSALAGSFLPLLHEPPYQRPVGLPCAALLRSGRASSKASLQSEPAGPAAGSKDLL